MSLESATNIKVCSQKRMLYTLYKRPTGQLRTSDNIFGIAIFRQTVLAAQIVWTVLAQELF